MVHGRYRRGFGQGHQVRARDDQALRRGVERRQPPIIEADDQPVGSPVVREGVYEEITASSLVTIDLTGKVLLNPHGDDYGINQAGYVIHSAVHAAREDVQCVIHTHSRAGMAVSALKCGLLPLTQSAMRFGGVTYHDYEGVAVDTDERERLARHLGDSEVMILRNHGLLSVGADIAQAFNAMYWLEMACRAQVDAMACNTELNLPAPAVIEKTAHQFKPQTRRPYGVMEWPAMLRYLDRRDPSYRA